MIPKSEAASIVADSINRGKASRDAGAEVAARLACRYYESIPEQIADMTNYYASLYKVASTWHSTRPKVAYGMTRAVTDELGQLYNRPVKRTFESDRDALLWDEIGGSFNPLMASVDRYTMLSGLVAVRPIVMPDLSMRWAYYTRDQIEYIPSALDPMTPEWVICSWQHGDVTIRHWWSSEYYVRTVDDVVSYTEEEDRLYPGGRHGYGKIPLVLFRNEAHGRTFYGEPASDLVQANRVINYQATAMNWTMVFQGASTLLMVGGDPSKLIEIGPESRVGLPEGADLRYISPDPAIQATIDAINLNLMLLCKSRRIPEDAFLMTRQGESGVAIVARQASLEDYRQMRGELFRPQEQELIQLAMLVYDGREIEAPAIAYEKPSRPMSGDLLAELQWRKQQHLITAADILMAEDSTLSREDAEARIAENRAANMATDDMVQEPVFGKRPPAVEPDEDEDEEPTDGE